MKHLLLTTIIVLLFSTCDNEGTQPIEENPLIGKWAESFSWTNISDCVIIGWEEYCPEIDETSTIEFSEETFEVTIMPPSRTFIVEDDNIYVGWASDTLYSGLYEISNDTIFFHNENSDEPTGVKYWLDNDSLHLAVISGDNMIVMDGDTSYIPTIPMGSFLWGNAWMKTYGTFGRVEQ